MSIPTPAELETNNYYTELEITYILNEFSKQGRKSCWFETSRLSPAIRAELEAKTYRVKDYSDVDTEVSWG